MSFVFPPLRHFNPGLRPGFIEFNKNPKHPNFPKEKMRPLAYKNVMKQYKSGVSKSQMKWEEPATPLSYVGNKAIGGEVLSILQWKERLAHEMNRMALNLVKMGIRKENAYINRKKRIENYREKHFTIPTEYKKVFRAGDIEQKGIRPSSFSKSTAQTNKQVANRNKNKEQIRAKQNISEKALLRERLAIKAEYNKLKENEKMQLRKKQGPPSKADQNELKKQRNEAARQKKEQTDLNREVARKKRAREDRERTTWKPSASQWSEIPPHLRRKQYKRASKSVTKTENKVAF